MFRIHCPALPHTKINSDYLACAYSQKVARFAGMMHDRGHEVFVYAPEGSNPACTEMVPILSTREQERFFGPHEPNRPYDVDWSTESAHWKLFNGNAIKAIRERGQHGDIISCAMGCQKPVADALPELHAVETGIGYKGSFWQYPPCRLPLFRCFESYCHLHVVRASEGSDPDDSPYDVVIPNYHNPEELPFQPNKKDYFLFVGRLTRRKGLQMAVEMTRKLGVKLIIAGQGALHWQPGQLVTREESYRGDHLEFVGPIDVKTRAKLMGEARALLAPTRYLEPWGGVSSEAQMCGTAVISSDAGGFVDNVEHGKTGFRCKILADYIFAAQNVHRLDPQYIHDRAVRLWSLDTVARMYESYFESICTPGLVRTEDWLHRF